MKNNPLLYLLAGPGCCSSAADSEVDAVDDDVDDDDDDDEDDDVVEDVDVVSKCGNSRKHA